MADEIPKNFYALELALEAVQQAEPFVRRLARLDAELHGQTRRALTRCVLALGEGSQRSGGNRQAAYRRARGEANEALVAVRLAVAWRYATRSDVEELLLQLSHLVAVLVRLTR